MDLKPKIEPGSPPSGSHRNLEDMSISELVSVLRSTFLKEDFDRVEDVLVNRDARLKSEIRSLRERIELERLRMIDAEEKLKKKEKQCEQGKKVQESYENLLKEVKKNGLVDRDTNGELRKKNLELERENCEMKELKKKWVEDSNALAELRVRVRVLEKEKFDDKNTLNAIRRKNGELEEAVEKHLATTSELTNKNRNLLDEKRKSEDLVQSLERKFGELNRRVLRLEDDTKLLMSVDASDCRNVEREGPQTDSKVTFAVKDEEDVHDYEFGMDTGGPTPLQRIEDTRHSLGAAGTVQSLSKGSKDARGASAGGRLELRNVEIINLDDDDDDDGCISGGLHGKKAVSEIMMKNKHPSSSVAVQQKNIFTKAQTIEMVKRKISFPDIGISTSDSSSSADSIDIDNLPLSSARLNVQKRSKT